MPHFIDWSTAEVEWTMAGFELSVTVAAGATFRQTSVVAEQLEAGLAGPFRQAELQVVAIEPDDDARPELTVTSPALFSVDPVALRREIDRIADASANNVLAAASRDREIAEYWLRALRPEFPLATDRPRQPGQ